MLCSIAECHAYFYRGNSSHRYTFKNLFVFYLQRTLKVIARARVEMGQRVPEKLVSKFKSREFSIRNSYLVDTETPESGSS